MRSGIPISLPQHSPGAGCGSSSEPLKVQPMTTERAVDTTPQIKGNYPLAGKRIGPAWRRIWRELGDGEVHAGRALAGWLAPLTDVAVVTIEEMLRQAASRGLIERVSVRAPQPSPAGGRRTLVAYRRTDVPHATSTRDAGGR